MARKGTVESALPAEDLHAFCKKLAAVPKLTLWRMQTGAEKLGIRLSRSASGCFAGEALSGGLPKVRGYTRHRRVPLGEGIYKDDGSEPYTSFELKFRNGTTIHSMSSNPDALPKKEAVLSDSKKAISTYLRTK